MPALIRQEIESIFLRYFPQYLSNLTSDSKWREGVWQFARKLEEAFLNHLESLLAHNGKLYLSDQVKVCWLRVDESNQLLTQGAWQTLGKLSLADYLHPEAKVIEQEQRKCFVNKPQGDYWGRLSLVESLIYYFPN